MTDIASSSDVTGVSTTSSREAQLDKLDDLWEQYLHWADEYQKTRKQLSQAMASGFFSLAQANFTNSSRARYGTDYYDERMQALRKVVVEPADEPWLFEVIKQKRKSTSIPAAELDGGARGSDTGPDHDASEQNLVDPLRWFGIFVPHALRESQTSFTQAVEGPIPRLATIARQMRSLEVAIGRLKKSIKKLG